MLDLWIKVIRQGVIGAVLILVCLWMIFYAGLLKKSYRKASANPSPQTFYWQFATKHWPSIEWLGGQHPVIWRIAPPFPPEMTGPTTFSWAFAKANWSLLCWLGIFYGGVWSMVSARHLLQLIGEVSREEKKDKIRRKMRGDRPTEMRAETTIEVHAEIRMQAAESGKWWSLNGAIVGGCIAAVLAQAINVWLRLAKP